MNRRANLKNCQGINPLLHSYKLLLPRRQVGAMLACCRIFIQAFVPCFSPSFTNSLCIYMSLQLVYTLFYIRIRSSFRLLRVLILLHDNNMLTQRQQSPKQHCLGNAFYRLMIGMEVLNRAARQCLYRLTKSSNSRDITGASNMPAQQRRRRNRSQQHASLMTMDLNGPNNGDQIPQ